MAFTEALRLLIDADTRGAVRGIEQVGAATDKSLGRSQKTIDKWGKGLTTAGAGMVAFGAAGLLGLGKAAQASEEANLAVVKLENTLGNMPKLAGENSKSFIDLAQSIQDKTAADADAIVEAEALLGTFRLTGDEIRRITPLVVDYSRKFGVDMTDAAKQVGKALDGQIGALRRSGVSIDENLFKTDRYAAVTQALRDQVGGFAEEEGKTFAGSLERLKNQLGDVAEGVGTGAVDAFTDLFGIVEGGINKFKDLSPATQETIGKFATLGSVALIAAGGLSFTIGQIIKMRDNFALARTAVADFAGSGGLGRLARVTLVVGGLIALREVLMSMDKDIDGIDTSKLENQLLDLAEAGEFSGGKLQDIFEGFGEAIANGDPQKLEAWSNQIDKVDEALAQLATRDPEAAAAAFEEINRSLQDQGASAEQVKDKFNNYAAAVAEADTASRTGAGGVAELGGAMGEAGDETAEVVSQLQEYRDQLQAMVDPIFGAMDAIQGNRDAQLAYRDAVVGVMEAQATLDEAIANHGATSDEAREATRGLEDAQRKLTDSQWATVKSAAEVDGALAELTDAVGRGDVSVDDFRATLRQWVAQGFLTQAQADEAAGSVADLARQADIADSKRIDIPAVVRDNASGTVRLIQQRIDSLTGKTVTVSVVASYTASASNALQTFGGRQAGGGVVPRYMQSGGVNWNMGAGPRGSDRIPAWLTPGELILNMGQQGKLFRAIESGQIGGRGAAVVNINVGPGAIVANDPKAVAEGLIRYVRRDGAGQLQRALGIR